MLIQKKRGWPSIPRDTKAIFFLMFLFAVGGFLLPSLFSTDVIKGQLSLPAKFHGIAAALGFAALPSLSSWDY